MKKNVKKYISMALALTLVCGSTGNSSLSAKAAGKVSLTKTAKIQIGKSSVLKLKNSKGKVSWNVTKGKDVVKIVKKKKDSCTVKGIKTGNAVVQATVGKKKLSCKVTVTQKNIPVATDKPEPTTAPTAQPTAAPTETQAPQPTVKPDDKNDSEVPDGVKVVEYDGTNRDEISSINEPFYVKIKDGVTNIGIEVNESTAYVPFLFMNKNVVGASIPASIKEIGLEAFAGCSNLKSVDIAGDITSIEFGAFMGCESLSKITIPKSVTNIEAYAFEWCESLTDITLSDGITVLSEGLFKGCTNLKNINIPESVTEIDALAFNGCQNIEKIYIPKNVKDIKIDYTDKDDNGDEQSYIGGVFKGCDNLQSIVVDAANPYYDSRENCNAIIDTKDNALIAGCKNSVLVDGIKEIGTCAFEGCVGLTTVEIPKSVEAIYYYAFSDCINLKEVKINSSEIKCAESAFDGCTSLNDNIVYASNS